MVLPGSGSTADEPTLLSVFGPVDLATRRNKRASSMTYSIRQVDDKTRRIAVHARARRPRNATVAARRKSASTPGSPAVTVAGGRVGFDEPGLSQPAGVVAREPGVTPSRSASVEAGPARRAGASRRCACARWARALAVSA